MKLLWLDLNSSYAHSSLALPALHAQVAASADDVEWFRHSATINENPGMIAAEVYRYAPDVVAATCWLFNHEVLLHVLARVHALLPEATILLGGPEFLGDNSEFLRTSSFVTAVFRGEGEESFSQWLRVWNQPESWSDISGLCYYDAQGNYHDQGIARVLDFDQLCSPEESSFFNWEKPFVQLETTRGCFNTCSFCVSGGEKPVRRLPLSQVRERLQRIHQAGIRDVRLLDRTFNYNIHYARQLLQLFQEFPGMRFHLEIHPALLTDELKQELLRLPQGLLHLEAGIQSLRADVLAECHRKGRLEDALSGLKFLCSLPNMETHADLIAGLPLYRLQDIFSDVVTLASYHAGEIQLESLKVLPGTDMRRRASELGLVYSSYPPYEVLMTPHITPQELQTARYLSRLLDAFYNAKTWQAVTRQLIIEQPDFLLRFLEHLQDLHVIDQPMALDRRGVILYEFCKKHYPEYAPLVAQAWIEGGLSLKKQPAEHVRTKHVSPPEKWNIVFGEYQEQLRLCVYAPPGAKEYVWYGYDSQVQNPRPVFKAISE